MSWQYLPFPDGRIAPQGYGKTRVMVGNACPIAFPKIENGKVYYREEMGKVLFIATGALLSSVSTQQGESIPGVAHAVVLES